MSLKDVIKTPINSIEGSQEAYTMITVKKDDNQIVQIQDRQILVKRLNIIYNDSECKALRFTDITANQKFRKEQEKRRMLQFLNVTVHHEMLSPLKSNVILTKRLLNDTMFENKKVKDIIKILSVSSELLLHHSNDLLDYRIIKNGSFMPQYTTASLASSVIDTVELSKSTLLQKKIEIECDV